MSDGARPWGRALHVRSSLGWPRTHVPVDEVLSAEETDVDPVRELGGWGGRAGRGGRVGIAVRRGPSPLVHRTGERSVAVPVDDARSAAALLNTLADRDRVARAATP